MDAFKKLIEKFSMRFIPIIKEKRTGEFHLLVNVSQGGIGRSKAWFEEVL